MPSEEVSQMAGPFYLLGSVAHVHRVINPVFQEAPSVLKVWGRVLHHHQLCRVVDASQHSSASIPVELRRNPPRKVGHHHRCGLGAVGVVSTQRCRNSQAPARFLLSLPDTMFLWTTLRLPNVAGHEHYLGR